MSPSRAPSPRRLVLLALAVAALNGADPAAAELWRWIDADGVARYTPDPGRVPAAQRSSLARVEAGMPAAPQPEPAAAPKPAAIFAPPGDPALAADPFNEPERAREIEGEIVVEVPTAAPAPTLPGPPAPAPPEELRSVEEPALPAQSRAPAPALPAETRARAPAEPALPPRAAVAQPPRAAVDSPPPARLSPERAARRAELVAAIERDEETLKTHVSSTAEPIAASAELREIAERLPALQAELRALEAQSAAP